MFSLVYDSYGGESFAQLSARFFFVEPCFLAARRAAIRYFAGSSAAAAGGASAGDEKEQQGTKLFAWPFQPSSGGFFMGPSPTFNAPEKEPTLEFLQSLLDTLGLGFSLPPTRAVRSGRRADGWGEGNPDAMSDVERRVRWVCASEFPQAPEFLWMRDLVLLYRASLEDTLVLFENNPHFQQVSLWFTSHAHPQWRFINTNNEKSAAAFLVSLCDDRAPFTLGSKQPESPISLGVLFASSGAAPGPGSFAAAASLANADEEKVLQKQQLPSFGDALSQEESERVLTYLTAPYVALPLLLEFFTQDRVGTLLSRPIQV